MPIVVVISNGVQHVICNVSYLTSYTFILPHPERCFALVWKQTLNKCASFVDSEVVAAIHEKRWLLCPDPAPSQWQHTDYCDV